MSGYAWTTNARRSDQPVEPGQQAPQVGWRFVDGNYFQAMQIRSADMAGVALPQQALRILEANTLDSLHESLRTIGLTLESRRAPMEVLVVDQIEKTPTDN